MLSWAGISTFSKIVIMWALLAVILQLAIAYFNIQYDSKLSLLWWFSSAVSFPAYIVIEILDVLGFRARGFWGYLITTVAICLLIVISREMLKSPDPA